MIVETSPLRLQPISDRFCLVISSYGAAPSALSSRARTKGFRLRHSDLLQLLHQRDWVHRICKEVDAGLHPPALGDQSGNGGRDNRVHPVLAASLKRYLKAMGDLTRFNATLDLDDTKPADWQRLR